MAVSSRDIAANMRTSLILIAYAGSERSDICTSRYLYRILGECLLISSYQARL